MSDSNLCQISYGFENDWGELITGEAYQKLNHTGESLRQATNVVKSQQVRSDRQTPYVVRTGLNAEGDINGEFHYGGYDDLMLMALMYPTESWGTVGTPITSGLTFTASGNTITASGGWSGYSVGQWLTIYGTPSPTTLKGYCKISDISGNDATVTHKVLVDGTGGKVVNGSYVVNGTTLHSVSIEKYYSDLSSKYAQLLGMCVNTWNLGFESDGLVTTSFGFMGKLEQSAASAAGSGYTASSTNPALNAIDNVEAVVHFPDGGSPTEIDITGYSHALNNNLRARLQVGTLGAISIGTGQLELSGTLQAYLNDHILMDNYLDYDQLGLGLIFDVATPVAAMVIDVPGIHFSSGQRVAGGINQDIIADMAWDAHIGGPTGAETTIGVHLMTHKDTA